MKTVEAKQFMTKTKLGENALTCNPYLGCSHGCTYCYAKTLKYQKQDKVWGSFVYQRVFPHYDIPKGTGEKELFLSSMTDAYQPSEIQTQATRKVLEAVKESHLHINILTKSSLVLRDLDLFKQMKHIQIGFSIGLEEQDALLFEPNASSVSQRIEALKKLKAEGISTYVFISPIIPYISNVKNIIDLVKDSVDYLMFDTLNLIDFDNRMFHYQMLEKHYKHVLEPTKKIYESKDYRFFKQLKQEILEQTEKYQLNVKYIF